MSVNNNNQLSIQSIFHTINELQTKIAKNSQEIIKVASNVQLATPKQISNILIDINNLQHKTFVLADELKDLQTKLIQLNGKFNQSIIKTNEVSNRITLLKKSIEQDSNKFFSWNTGRQLLIGVVLAALLYILGGICSNMWQAFIERQANKINPQIKVQSTSQSNKNLKK